MTPSTEELTRLLTGAADDIVEGHHGLGPDAPALWGRGRRATWAARGAAVGVVAAVVAAIGLAVWPTGAPRTSDPAVMVDVDGTTRLTAYPDVIAKAPNVLTTTTPGVTAAVVPGEGPDQVYAVSPAGVVSRVPLPREESQFGAGPALSPDGRWVAHGPALSNLVTGATVPPAPARAQLERTWGSPEGPAWWSPDSRRIFVGTVNEGQPRFGGVVIGTDGSTTEVPVIVDGIAPIFAGWLDDTTLLALLDLGPGSTRLELRTWTFGDTAWTDRGTVISWSPKDTLTTRASLSPDGSRLLLVSSDDTQETQSIAGTNAMMFDPRTGAQLGMPAGDGSLTPSQWGKGTAVTWKGWGCRSAWRGGLPVITDGSIRGFVDTDPTGLVDGKTTTELVAVSPGYGEACVAFAGNELRGTPVTNHLAVWQERLWTWGWPLLGVDLVVLALWGWNRRHKNLWRRPLGHLPPIIAKPF